MKLAAITLFFLLLSGCGSDKYESGTQPVGATGIVREIQLSDGTVCAAYKHGHAGGITCNWK